MTLDIYIREQVAGLAYTGPSRIPDYYSFLLHPFPPKKLLNLAKSKGAVKEHWQRCDILMKGPLCSYPVIRHTFRRNNGRWGKSKVTTWQFRQFYFLGYTWPRQTNICSPVTVVHECTFVHKSVALLPGFFKHVRLLNHLSTLHYDTTAKYHRLTPQALNSNHGVTQITKQIPLKEAHHLLW